MLADKLHRLPTQAERDHADTFSTIASDAQKPSDPKKARHPHMHDEFDPIAPSDQ